MPNNNNPLTLSAPLSGPVLALNRVPDEVFASGAMGDGLAIDPLNDCLHAPCDGVIIHVARTGHALVPAPPAVGLVRLPTPTYMAVTLFIFTPASVNVLKGTAHACQVVARTASAFECATTFSVPAKASTSATGRISLSRPQ